jgi:hypothetical protein
MQAKGASRDPSQRAHAIDLHRHRDAATILEEAHQALEGVGPVAGVGEPPEAVSAPRQDRPKHCSSSEIPHALPQSLQSDQSA